MLGAVRLMNIIKKPINATRKAVLCENTGTYVFKVDKDATKIDIKKAIEYLYGEKVESVTVSYLREKYKYGRKGIVRKRKEYKKAYVTFKNPSFKLDVTLMRDFIS